MGRQLAEESITETRVHRAMREAAREGHERRLQYLASLDPRERELLAMGDPF